MGTRDLNKIMLTGQVEAEPEMRFTNTGEARTTFYLICATASTHHAAAFERFRLVAWGQPLAERCNNLLQGTRVLVEGRLQRCTADHADEQARFAFDVLVRECVVIDTGDTAALMVPVPPPPPTLPTHMAQLPAARPAQATFSPGSIPPLALSIRAPVLQQPAAPVFKKRP